MLKLLGAVLIVGACTSLGMAAKQRLAGRIAAITSLLDALDTIAAELSYQQTPLPEIIAQLRGSHNRTIARLFTEMSARAERGGGMSLSYHWQTAVRDLYAELGMEAAEAEILRDAAAYLGRYRLEQQLTGIAHTRQRLEAVRAEACEALRSKGNIYRTCGVAVGIVTVLVML